jgi:DNA-binding CsgD family transcriptional regulator
VAVGTPHLVGREEELASLLAVLDAPDGLPGAAVVFGEAGIGKTALWLAAAEAAAARSFRVLSCRPSEAEARFSFSGLADLVGGGVADVFPELPRPQREALETALALSDSQGTVDEGVVAFAFLSAVRRLAEDKRVLLAVDDVQWLDAPSLDILRFAIARLREEEVAALLACRGHVPDWLRRALPDERILAIEVGALSLGALHELLRARFGTSFPRPTLIRLWETSGGNPFFGIELARALERRGGRLDPGAELPIPNDLDELLHERLRTLTRPAQQVARAVAVLAEPTPRIVEAAFGSPGAEGLDDALDARVLELDGERIRFNHPLLASAVVARTPPRSRRALHARLATVVDDEEERVRHLALAASGPDSEVANTLEAAAGRARSRGAAAGAADLVEQALRLTPPGDLDTIRRRTVEAADHVYAAGDSARAIYLLEDGLADLAPGPARASILCRLAAVHTQATGPREGAELYLEALSQTHGADVLDAAIHLELADTIRFTAGMARAAPHAEAAVRAAERAGDDGLLCRALAVFGLIQFKLGHGIQHEVMARAVGLEESLGLAPAMWSPKALLCDQLFWSNELDAARALAEEVRDALHRRADPYEADLLWWLALIDWRAGSWARAAELVEAGMALDEQTGREGLSPIVEWPRALIAAHRGFVDEARELARDALARAQSAGILTAEASHRWVLGFIELSVSQPEAALPHLRAARELRETLGHAEPGLMAELTDLLDALVAVGELGEAEAVAAPWEERARTLDRAWALAICARVRALVRAARGDLEGALGVFDEALAEHARTQDPFQHARTLLALGATRRRAKRRAVARATLEQALAMFEQLGAPLWAGKARAELARIGGRAPSRGELTESEARIAALVAAGRTNREVAAALFLTEQTVATALTRVYRKLGVRSRAELARHRADQTQDAKPAKT